MLWGDVAEELMYFITLEGRFSVVNAYHVILLNHFCHKKRISFPYYLLVSLDSGLKDHKKNTKNHVLHVGLILLIYEYAKSFEVAKVIFTPKSKRFKPTEEYETASEEEPTSKKEKTRKLILDKESDSKEDVEFFPESLASLEVGPQSLAVGKTKKGSSVLTRVTRLVVMRWLFVMLRLVT